MLPDLPASPKSFTINGLNLEKNKEDNVNVSFRGYERDSIWLFESAKSTKIKVAGAVSKHVEEDYSNALVKCINPNLKSIYDRSGVVVQVLPGTNYIEIDVDYGRGLGVQRMSEKDIEIILEQ